MDKQEQLAEIKRRIAELEGETIIAPDESGLRGPLADKSITKPIIRVDAYHSGWLDSEGNEAQVPDDDDYMKDVSSMADDLYRTKLESIAMSRSG